MAATSSTLTAADRQVLIELAELAATQPVDMFNLVQKLATPGGKAAHRQQITTQARELSNGFLVSFSIETGHPGDTTCRHLAISEVSDSMTGTVVREIAAALGFVIGPEDELIETSAWLEDLRGRGLSVNLVQVIRPTN